MESVEIYNNKLGKINLNNKMAAANIRLNYAQSQKRRQNGQQNVFVGSTFRRTAANRKTFAETHAHTQPHTHRYRESSTLTCIGVCAFACQQNKSNNSILS